MARNIRQRRRLQAQKKHRFQMKVLFILVICMTVACVISFGFKLFGENSLNNLFKTTADELASKNNEPEKTEQEANPQENNSENNTEKTNEEATFVLTGIGDILTENSLTEDALVKETNTYNFSYLLENIKYYTQTSDLVIGNLEASFAGEENKLASYNAPDTLANNLKSIGVNVLTTATNHSLDYNIEGLNRTIDTLNKADISHTGTFKTQEEHDNILFKYSKGIKIAILNFAYGTDKKIPEGQEYSINIIDRTAMSQNIAKAKEQGADVIVACLHWGNEFKTTPENDQKDLADFLFMNGVNVILGTHPHVLQPIETRTVTLEDGTQKQGLVVYSLGTFIGNLKSEASKSSALVNIKITKHKNNTITIDSSDYVPTYFYKEKATKETETKGAQLFKIFDIERSITAYDAGDLSLGSKNYELLKKKLEEIKKSLGE